MSSDLLLSVVEELKGIQSKNFINNIYDPNFWLDFVPFRRKLAEKISDRLFCYELEDTFILDPTGTLKYDLYSKGEIEVLEDTNTEKGRFWKLKIISKEPKTTAFVNVRLKDIQNGIKVGFFLYELHLDLGLLDSLGFGREAVLFATRATLRHSISIFHHKLRNKILFNGSE
ncbi:MAG: hypothetical protein JW776_08620 [Candidatus Lokiarchaeota archaeon]|nr:hypothetical protein [Candidatus Lokiarchaeota archaeon]